MQHSSAMLCAGTALALSLFTTFVPAQEYFAVVPNIGPTGTASSSTAYPWGRQTASVRVQYSYDASEVPATGTIVITRLAFRPLDTAATTTTWVGGTYGAVTILMSNGVYASASLSTTFATNHGTNVTTVYNGAVKVLPGTGTGTGVPSPQYVVVNLTTPFLYDPTKGALLVDIAIDGSTWVPNTGTPAIQSPAVTYTTENKPVSRMYNLTSHTATTGSFQNLVGLVMEMSYTGGTSPVGVIGKGCSDGFGKIGELYTTQQPTVGNANFDLQGKTLPPSAPTLLIAGINKSFPSFELTPAGAPGCSLHSDSVIEFLLLTTSGTPSLSDGTIKIPVPIPNDANLKGFFLRTQIAVADANSKRGLKAIFTNGLGITVQ